jgi:hypothetical protein
LALYISNAGTKKLPMFIPIPRDATATLAPVEIPVLVLRVRGTTIVDTTDPMVLKKNESIEAAPFPRSALTGSVLAWTEYDESDRREGSHWEKLSAPEIALRAGDVTLKPTIPVRPANGTDRALVLFRGVPPGKWQVGVEGEFWRRDAVSGEVAAGAFASAARGLRTGPAGAIEVGWTVTGTPATADAACAGGKNDERPVPRRRATVLSCEGLQAGLTAADIDLAQCKPMRNRTTFGDGECGGVWRPPSGNVRSRSSGARFRSGA